MFGLEFLFSAALFALPLAALPLILHLLNRRKSPVVQFPTLRLVKASLQHSAARRKVQRWLLLAIRMLLLALLIWAVAQPAKTLAARFFSSGSSSVAVIVVDTSWSMQYRRDQVPLIAEAEAIVQQLLREQLRDSSVLMITSAGGDDRPFRSASEILASWVPLQASADSTPVSDRALAAMELLTKQPGSDKLLVLVSDFQSRDFPRPLASLGQTEVRVVALDLHPEQARSAGVQKISLSSSQAVAGLPLLADVEVAGPPGDARPVQLDVTSLDGSVLLTRPTAMASFDEYGQALVRFDLVAPADRWQLITARVLGEDPMSWDDARQLAMELPEKQPAKVIGTSGEDSVARRFVRLALDPSEGALANWPLAVDETSQPGKSGTAVALIDSVEDLALSRRLRDFATEGGTVVLFLRPGLEAAWPESADSKAMEELLPSPPYQADAGALFTFMAAGGARSEPSMSVLSDGKALEGLRAHRIVPMGVGEAKSTRLLIAGAAGDGRPSTDRGGLLYVRRVGDGRVFTFAAIPDGMNTNLGTHPMFLPLLVSISLRPAEASRASNVLAGEPVTLQGVAERQLELHAPGGEVFRVRPQGGRFVFAQTQTPGLYQWVTAGKTEPAAIAQVSLPGDESQAIYRPAETLIPVGENVLVARSLEEMTARVAEVSQPQPKWTVPLALVLMLLCVEAAVSTATRWPKWLSGWK